MRTTVGPLPPAVYWRRRAVVLGAVLLVALLWFVSCGGEDDDGNRGTGASSQAPTPAPATSTPRTLPACTTVIVSIDPAGGGALLIGVKR